MSNFDAVVTANAAQAATFNVEVANNGCSKVRLTVNVTGGGPGQFTPVIEYIDGLNQHHELLMGEPFSGVGEYRYQVGPGFDDDDDDATSANDFVSKRTNFKFICDSGTLTFQATAQFNV